MKIIIVPRTVPLEGGCGRKKKRTWILSLEDGRGEINAEKLWAVVSNSYVHWDRVQGRKEERKDESDKNRLSI